MFLWEELLEYLDHTFQDIKWVKVPSHANVKGNEQVNTLANQGQVDNPLYPVEDTPWGSATPTFCTPAPADKKQKVLPPEDSPLHPLALTFDYFPDSPLPQTPPAVLELHPVVNLEDPGLKNMSDATADVSPAHSVLGGMFARHAPGACPARYLCIKYLISSPKFILTLGSPPSRPH